MTDIKCPYCDKTLHCGAQLDSDGHIIELYQCANPECESTEFLVGCKEFWDILGQHKRTAKAVEQIKKLRKQNRILRESLAEYFDKWIDANIKAMKDKDQIRVLTEQEQARHQLIIDQLKGLK